MKILTQQTKAGIELLGNVELVPDFSKPVTFTDIRGRKTKDSFSTLVEHAVYSIISQPEPLVYVFVSGKDLELSTIYKYVSRHVMPTLEKVYSMHRAGSLMPAIDLSNLTISYRVNLTGIYIYTTRRHGK